MYFTYVVRPGEAPEGRGPVAEPFWTSVLYYMLRIGFALQLVSHIGLLLLVGFGINKPFQLLNFYNLRTDSVGSTPVWAVILFIALGALGSIAHVGFLVISDDDSSIKQSRGFRAGTKSMAQATSFAIVSYAITLISFYAANNFYSDQWMDDQIGSGAKWLVYYASRCTDIAALLLYGGAVFCLETYHSEGAGELWGWLIALAFKGAAYAEIIAITFASPETFPVADQTHAALFLLALISGFVWSLKFEPLSQRYDVRLTQSAMRSEYYKSRNAIAYYGPAVVNADGALDIQNSRLQDASCR